MTDLTAKARALALAENAKADKTTGKTTLAKGVNGRNAPHSSKSIADARKGTSKPAKAGRKAANGTPTSRSEKRTARIELLVKPADTKLKGGRLAKLETMWSKKPKTVADIVGTKVTDSAGKSHVLDMGAINGMAKRGHIKLVA